MNVFQSFFTLNILFDKVDSREVETRKKYYVRYHLYSYFLKNCYGLSKLMTCIYTFKEQVLYRKYYFRNFTLEKSLKRFITKYIPDVTFEWHKFNVLITTVVDGSIF